MMKWTHRAQRPAGGSVSVLGLVHGYKVQLLQRGQTELLENNASNTSTVEFL